MRDHFLIIHRWSDSYADYAAYLDHATHDVSYVTTARAAASLPAGAAGVRTVPSTEDGAAVRAAVSSLIGQLGVPARIVALHEVDLDMAAALREELGVPGQTSEELAPFRDKLVMAERLAGAGVPVPATRPAPDCAAVEAFAADHGWPVLVKPVRGTASQRVSVLRSKEALDAHDLGDVPLLVQEYLPHDVLHVDGVAGGGDLLVWRVSRYLTTCLQFTEGVALGSAEVDDAELTARVGAFTAQALRALSPGPLVFHLELFLSGSRQAPDLRVLEVGARPGGAEVPFVWKDVHGVDLMEVAFAVQAGAALPSSVYRSAPDGGADCGGWLLVPTPAPRPCRVVAATSQLGKESGPYAERVPAVGETLAEVPGYEHAGARFRFRAASTAAVEAAIRSTLADFDFRCTPEPAVRDRVVLVGMGGRAYREYALAAAAARAEVFTVGAVEPTWQLGYVSGYRVVPELSADAVTGAVQECMSGAEGRVGVMTWDEVVLATTSEVAARLSMPHMSPAATRHCRDKFLTRQALQRAGLPAVKFAHVTDLGSALRQADAIGYPVVVKPRSLAGSVGVAVARDPEELRSLYRRTVEAAYPGLDPLQGVMIEEYLDGPEISVDSVVSGGSAHVANVARKRLDFSPYFEEVGHLVSPWRQEAWAEAVTDLVVTAHGVLGVETGVTHAEVRLTAAGPRLVELNGRLGGDFIPYLGHLATGVDLTAAAVALAMGRRPDLTPSRDVCAEVRFVYPPEDCHVLSVDVSSAQRVAGVVDVVPLASAGTTLLLPPRGIVPRLAAVIVTGGTPEACADAVAHASDLLECSVEPLRQVEAVS